MPNSCICCGQVKKKNERVSMFRFPADPKRRQQWLEALGVAESAISEQSRVCSRHFLHGDSSNVPVLNLGSRFASPRKKESERSKRAQKRRDTLNHQHWFQILKKSVPYRSNLHQPIFTSILS